MRAVAILILSFTLSAQSLKILGIFPTASYSHYEVGSSLFRELARKGHELTVIAPYTEKPELKNFKTIHLDGFKEEMTKMQKKNDLYSSVSMPSPIRLHVIHGMGYKLTEDTLKHPNVQKLLKSEETFDIVIVEQFINEALVAFCHHYQAPCIKFSSTGTNYWTNGLVGNPSNPAYVPEMLLNEKPPLSLCSRIWNSILYIYTQIYYNLYVITTQNNLMQKYFPGIPSVKELNEKIDLVLLNSHVSTNQAVPYVPSMKEIGGLHIKPPKKLPENLQTYLDKSKNGVVYFSMGSNLKSKDMPIEKRDEILRVFSKLDMNVLWKFEDEKLPDKPKNVLIQGWVPQQDVLAHPNVKLFITHGGLLSTTEAIYNGVPVVGIPIFGDQWTNMLQAQHAGFAIPIRFNNLTETSLSWAVNEVLTNKIYGENAKTLSKVFHDRPMKPLDEAVFWVEYIGRHNGAKHLRSVALDLAWYQYYLLDVGLLFFLIAGGLLWATLCVCRKLCGKSGNKCCLFSCSNKNACQKDTDKKNK